MTGESRQAGQENPPAEGGAQPGGPLRAGTDDPWPDDLWPDEDALAAPARLAGSRGPRAGSGRPRWPALARVAAIALVAAAIGTGAALVVHDLLNPGGTTAAGQPGLSAPGGAGQPGGSQPGGSGIPPGASGQAIIVGQVTAVSKSSITIAGSGHSITAAITGSTTVAAKGGISGIKVGDEVSAQLAVSGSQVTVIQVADPPQVTGGGGQP